MKITRLTIENFRGVKMSELLFTEQVVLVGDNNSGKSTILEAIDLVLGPERLSRQPIIDEHDFYAGQYIDSNNKPVEIRVEVVLTELSSDQEVYFRNNLVFWNKESNQLILGPPPNDTNKTSVSTALHLGFRGYYDEDEDDFAGETFFLSPAVLETDTRERLGARDKRRMGFLYLRSLRTGRRALSLERGSLLDVILKLKELRPQMWEGVLTQLHEISVATDSELGISNILRSVQEAVRRIVPIECADSPSIKVSNLTREHLRQVLTVFMGTGIRNECGCEYLAPYTNQGTGTINSLVLTLLSMIAELKQNVIFAMEEPETAIPPHTQKRIISSVILKSSQAIFTSHSPYVLEEFAPNHIISISRENGLLSGVPLELPPNVKEKAYRDEVKRRFCEALLSRRVLITEGRTEYDAIKAVSRRLEELEPKKYLSLDGLGVSVIDAQSDSQISPLGEYFRNLGKKTYAVYDKQELDASLQIANSIDHAYESKEKGIENVILNGSDVNALRRYAVSLVAEKEWPEHLASLTPHSDMFDEDVKKSLLEYFKSRKGAQAIANFLSQCSKDEMPIFFVETIDAIHDTISTRFSQDIDKASAVEEGE